MSHMGPNSNLKLNKNRHNTHSPSPLLSNQEKKAVFQAMLTIQPLTTKGTLLIRVL